MDYLFGMPKIQWLSSSRRASVPFTRYIFEYMSLLVFIPSRGLFFESKSSSRDGPVRLISCRAKGPDERMVQNICPP